MDIENKRQFIIKFCWSAIILLLLYVAFKLLGTVLLPFVFGFIIAAIIKTPVNYIYSKFGKNRRAISSVFLTVVYLLLALLITLIVIELYYFMVDKVAAIPKLYATTIEPNLNMIVSKMEEIFPQIEETIGVELGDVLSKAVSFVTGLVSNIVTRLTSAIISLPALLISAFIVIASSYFFALDYNSIVAFFLRQFSTEAQKKIIRGKNSALKTIRDYLRVYGIIIMFTFVELMIGFTIIGVSNKVVIAFFIACVDILPILGTGTFLVPWSVISLILGDIRSGVGIMILYVVISIIRQILEPKVVGSQIGIPPLLTLLGIYIGGQVMGFFGIIIVPIAIAVVKNLNDDGILHLYKVKQPNKVENTEKIEVQIKEQ